MNILPKCTRLHQIASQISEFSQGDTPDSHPWGEGHPISSPLPARLAPRGLRPLDGLPRQFHTPLKQTAG